MQITELLQRVHAGDQQALNDVIPLVYDELKKLAAGHLRREGKARRSTHGAGSRGFSAAGARPDIPPTRTARIFMGSPPG